MVARLAGWRAGWLQIWDFPGNIDFIDPAFDSETIFGGCGALVFVIDAQDDYMESLAKLHLTVTKAYKVNPLITFQVFIHKVDGLSDDHKIGALTPTRSPAIKACSCLEPPSSYPLATNSI